MVLLKEKIRKDFVHSSQGAAGLKYLNEGDELTLK